MRALAVSSEFQGGQIVLISYSDTVYNLVLSANAEDHCIIPAGATKVLIKPTNIIYVQMGTSSVQASIPSMDITNGTGVVVNPPGFLIGPTDTKISIISPGACKVSLEFFL